MFYFRHIYAVLSERDIRSLSCTEFDLLGAACFDKLVQRGYGEEARVHQRIGDHSFGALYRKLLAADKKVPHTIAQ